MSLRLGLRQSFPEASMVRSHGMNDINRARGSWENSKVPSPSLGLLTALYCSLQGWRRRERAGYWRMLNYLQDFTYSSQ